MSERLTATERRIKALLAQGYKQGAYNGQRTVPLIPPGVINSWDSRETVWVRRSTLTNLQRKLASVPASTTGRSTDE